MPYSIGNSAQCSITTYKGKGSRKKDIYTHTYVRRRQWQPTPVLLPGKSQGQRSLVGCSPWGPEELDMTERLHFHFSLSFTGEGNGNPLQCSCLENPREGGAWWAAVYGVTQSRTPLKRLSSSSSPYCSPNIFVFYTHILILKHLSQGTQSRKVSGTPLKKTITFSTSYLTYYKYSSYMKFLRKN